MTLATPAMAANLTTRLWSWDDVLNVIDALNTQKVRGPCKKVISNWDIASKRHKDG
jgi:hypothetical protein